MAGVVSDLARDDPLRLSSASGLRVWLIINHASHQAPNHWLSGCPPDTNILKHGE